MKILNGFLKWLALLAICLAAGLIAIIYFSIKPEIADFWLRIIVILAVALIGSLVCRMFFHRIVGALLFLIALVTEVLALLVIDYFYEDTYRLTFLSHNFILTLPTPGDIAQGILLLLVTLPALFLFRRRKKAAPVQAEPDPQSLPTPQPAPQTLPAARPQVSLNQRVQPVLYSMNPANWQMTQDVGKQVKKVAGSAKKAVHSKSVHVNTDPGPVKAKQSPKAIKPAMKKAAVVKTASKARKSRKAQNNDVKLMGEEEHVCPYCLEKVNKDDEKVICPECGTWHHKECWDLTGTCGVAHRNEL